ncbi:hypothetical protein DdX_17932 [Ditylenchus destructor]|uniref:Uncharacterized protein n=1 Tax=Ditylenchus destructor TaxID=166010 RepID=A0AAD4MLN1_9BILA|nr:hypothetical protein DdX_17932 [Ditylenchus destructor]
MHSYVSYRKKASQRHLRIYNHLAWDKQHEYRQVCKAFGVRENHCVPQCGGIDDDCRPNSSTERCCRGLVGLAMFIL